MKLLSPSILPKHFPVMDEIEANMKTIFSMLVFTPALQANNLLQRYFLAIQHLRDVRGIKVVAKEDAVSAGFMLEVVDGVVPDAPVGEGRLRGIAVAAIAGATVACQGDDIPDLQGESEDRNVEIGEPVEISSDPTRESS